ncbi:hypothetical protein AMTRI_Chr02g264650 [Amborella trichopoda]|uniref:F-box domain-containing protein n=2 Tax=Amborella trichopoda TaxID=13333 RepID=U5D3C7_AMBTC|nr:hypothetical protein AMTR_s00057p00182580 [Amborella trichopoda]
MAMDMVSKSANSRRDINCNFLPMDIALHIASLLQISDLCSLGSSCRFWRNLCASDCMWHALLRERWSVVMEEENNNAEIHRNDVWRSIYIKRHKEMACRAVSVIEFVKQRSQYESLEIGDYLGASEMLFTLGFGFKDVQLILLTTKHSVLLNLIGLHYLLFRLNIEPERITRALCGCRVSERQVCIRWWKLGQWSHGFRRCDEMHVRRSSLGELFKPEKSEILSMLYRGVIHEVLRVQISADFGTSAWARRDMHSQR